MTWRYYKSERRFCPGNGGEGRSFQGIVRSANNMDFAAARYNMVENQIRANGVSDLPVIRALMDTPREVFLPKAMRGFAYLDEDVPISPSRFLIEPLVLARLLQSAEIRPSDVVLAIGDATGWASAVLSKLASTVVSLECEADLASRASTLLSELGCDNVAVVRGALNEGYPAQAPYDVIVFIGAVAEVPVTVGRQLADHGRLVAVVNGCAGIGRVVRVVRARDTFGRRMFFDAATPYLPGLSPKAGFRF